MTYKFKVNLDYSLPECQGTTCLKQAQRVHLHSDKLYSVDSL